VTPDKQSRTIFVDTLGVKTTQFDLTHDMQVALFNSGSAAAKKWMQEAAG
jgi:NTE family protein